MLRTNRRWATAAVVAGMTTLTVTACSSSSTPAKGGTPTTGPAGAKATVVRAALPAGAISHILVVDLENESFGDTFGTGSPARYLNGTLVPAGELLSNYYATGHVSLDNYLAQVSGQAPNRISGSDCLDSTTLRGQYVAVANATPDSNQAKYPGQYDGDGCVYPAGTPTIASQLDAAYPPDPTTHLASWREYAEDMGNTPSRDGGAADPLGAGTDCAHPPLNRADPTESATAVDQYADRHNPFIYFQGITDNTAECDANVVPLGKPAGGHLMSDLAQADTTPRFAFVTPNLCDDGHDGTCAGTNIDGTKTGGLSGADLWLKAWMPVIMASPAYQSGQMLVVVTFDEGAISDSSACCNEQPGPSWAWPGLSALLAKGTTPAPGADPGGGRIGAVLLNSKYIQPGTTDATAYNHYSALRSYEDLLGLTKGGTDGLGHIGFAAAAGLAPFGSDVFNRHS